MPASLASIAKRAGVSIATVSLALRGKGPVAKETAALIKRIAEEEGYRPNPLLAALATKRFHSSQTSIGTPVAIFNFPAYIDDSAGDSHQRQYIDDIMSEAARQGYAPKVYDLRNDSKTPPLFRDLYHSMVQGVIILGSMDMASFGRGFDWSQFSVAICARFAASLPFHTVRPDIFNSVKLAFGELHARGYRRIGFAMVRHAHAMEDDEARHGAAVALEYSYLEKKNRLPVFLGSFSDEEPFLRWVEKNKPDAVLGFGTWQYSLLRKAGYRMPRDIGFASMHLPTGDENQPCSGLVQNTDEIARQSVLLLDQLIRNRERGLPARPLSILVPSSWREGKTVRPRPRTGKAARAPKTD